MSAIDLYYGKQQKLSELPLKHGRFMIGAVPDSTRAIIYVDMKNSDGNIVRYTIDVEEYVKRLESLEEKVTSSPEVSEIPQIVTINDNDLLLTSNGENIYSIAYKDLAKKITKGLENLGSGGSGYTPSGSSKIVMDNGNVYITNEDGTYEEIIFSPTLIIDTIYSDKEKAEVLHVTKTIFNKDGSIEIKEE